MSWWSFVPAILNVGSALYSGQHTAGNKKFEASLSEKRGKEELALASRDAQESDRQGKLIESRALAIAAASGSSVADPDVVNLLGHLEADTEYRILNDLYRGKSDLQNSQVAAGLARKEGRSAKRASYIRAGTAIGEGYSSFRQNYG